MALLTDTEREFLRPQCLSGFQLDNVVLRHNTVVLRHNNKIREMTILVDPRTGEVVESGRIAFIPGKRQNGFKEGWTAVSSKAMEHMFKLREEGVLKPRHVEALMYLCTVELDFENWIRINQTETAKKLCADRHEFSKTIKKLVELEFMLEGPKVGRSKTYRLNPYVGWKGSSKNHKKALAESMGFRVIEGGKSASEGSERDPNTVDFITGKTDRESD